MDKNRTDVRKLDSKSVASTTWPVSRTMRLEDYEYLDAEVKYVRWLADRINGLHPHQHQHRVWEYALLHYVYKTWQSNYDAIGPYQVADFGCGVGLSAAMLRAQGNHVTMYEPWVYGDESEFQMTLMDNVTQNFASAMHCSYQLLRRPLCELVQEDYDKYDISLCVSTLEHIGEYQRAFDDLCKTVKKDGLLFLTFDFAEREQDTYMYADLRAGRMFTAGIVQELAERAMRVGFRYFRNAPTYGWDESCRLVNDYGFASLVMVRSGAHGR